MDDCKERFLSLLMHRNSTIFFYINFTEHRWYIEENPSMPPEMRSDALHPVDAILHSGCIVQEDILLYRGFAERLQNAVEFGCPDDCLRVQFRMINNRRETIWYAMEIFPVKDGQLRFLECSCQLRLLSNREIMACNMLKACHDDMAPAVFTDVLAKHMEQHPDEKYAFIQFDVVRFKLINDNYGEAAGTELLQHFLDVLGVVCNDDQFYTRLSADIFMVVIPCREESEVCDFIRHLEAKLSGYKGMDYQFAFGVYIASERSVSLRVMGDSAAIARHSVKGNALNNIGFFDASLKETIKSKKNIEDHMRIGLEQGQFHMYLQPKYSIVDQKIIGAEALVRWVHPKRGLIPPSEFIPVFEQNGFIVKLDAYIWECACRQLAKWLADGITPVPISVNVSGVHLSNPALLSQLETLMEKYQLPKHLLELEITESVENINGNTLVRDLKKSGFTLLMDDFGSGYSSLNMLNRTPFDILKIDKDFLASLIDSERGQKIISHTIAMSHDVGLGLIAEGVETKEQADFLYSCGCAVAQGFYYSRAVPTDEFEKMLLA